MKLDSLVDSYHSILKFTLDAYASEKTRLVLHRPCAPWYSDNISVQKNIGRSLNANADLQNYLQTENVVFSITVLLTRTGLPQLSGIIYSSKIQENSGNTGILFKTVEKLLNSNPAQRYPSSTNNLSESFADFFPNKIVRIRNDLYTFSRIPNDGPVTPCSTKTESCLASQFLGEFRLVDEEVISGYVSNLCTKSCALDPIPSSVF